MTKERSVRISEVFYSLEGEGPFSGRPTIFVRTFGCNFTCQGFNNPMKEEQFVSRIEKLDQFYPVQGCDSIYAWHKDYMHLTTLMTISELVAKIHSLLPGTNVSHSNRPILSFTGGEPMLHQRFWTDLLPHIRDFDTILMETNGTQEVTPEFKDAIYEWSSTKNLFVWSNSPKLSNSGESEYDAIVPRALASQVTLDLNHDPRSKYLKFVTDGSPSSIREIIRVIEQYKDEAAIDIGPESIWLMPEGATILEQQRFQLAVAHACLRYGFNFCPRVHIWVFNNAPGT